MTSPTVSIITPTFNHALYIEQCIRSVQSQTFTDWEQIVIDDGSTDSTVDLVEDICDARLTVLRQQNVGIENLGSTYNRALAAAKGSLIAILEGDDFWPATLLETLVSGFEDPSVVLTYGRTQMCTEDGIPIERYIPTPSNEKRLGIDRLRNDPIGAAADGMCLPDVLTFTFPCSTILRRQQLEDIGGFQHVDGLPFTDFPTLLQMAFTGTFAYLPQVGGFWRQRMFSGTRTRDEIAVFERLLEYSDETFSTRRSTSAYKLPASTELRLRWARRRGGVRFSVGRRMLLLGQWREARLEFISALLTEKTPLQIRAVALIGLLGGVLHVTLEPMVRWFRGASNDMRDIFRLDRHSQSGPHAG